MFILGIGLGFRVGRVLWVEFGERVLVNGSFWVSCVGFGVIGKLRGVSVARGEVGFRGLRGFCFVFFDR